MSTDSGSLFPPTHQRWHRWLTLTTILIAIAMVVVDQELKTNHAPMGIISLQLAGTTQAARLVVYDWHPRERLAAAFGLGLDYLFLLSYSAWFFVGCRWSAERWVKPNPSRGNLFAWLSWGAILAALLDGVENVVLLIFLQSDGKSVFYPVAFWCAVVKFLLILMAICLWIFGNFAPCEGGAPKPVPKKA